MKRKIKGKRWPLRWLYAEFARPALFFLCLFILWGVAPFFAAAEGETSQPVTREEVLSIAEELVTPGGCPSLTLAECTTSTAFQIRDEIAQMLAQGMEKEEIIDALVSKYGDLILGAPARSGWGLVLWYGPYVLMGVAVLFLVTYFYQVWQRRKTGLRSPVTSASADLAPFHQDMQRYHPARSRIEENPDEENLSDLKKKLDDALKDYL